MDTVQTWAAAAMLVAFLAEAVINWRHNLHLFDRRDAVNNVILGVLTIAISLIMKGVMYGTFSGMKRVALFDIENTWWTVLLLLLISDLHYYWFHRLAHISRFLWTSHVIHHSSEKYNLTVGIRLPFTNGFYRLLFWSPLCLAGFSPEMVFLMDGIVVYYTFFLHTETVGKLGVLERVLNTPSHHRVHHSSNPQYIDKNFGGMLIVWDKLFGTYAGEKEKPVYGTTRPLRSYSLVKIVFDEWIVMLRTAARASGAGQVLKALFGHPAWKPGVRNRPVPVTGPEHRKRAALRFALSKGFRRGRFARVTGASLDWPVRTPGSRSVTCTNRSCRARH